MTARPTAPGKEALLDVAYTLFVQRSYAEVSALSEEKGVSLRTAAQMIGVGRVAEAHRTRGLYP